MINNVAAFILAAVTALVVMTMTRPTPPRIAAPVDRIYKFDGHSNVIAASSSPDPTGVVPGMEQILPDLKLDNLTLKDALDFLSDITHQNIVPNWLSLESAGIDQNATVTTHLKNIRSSDALSIILSKVGGGNVRLAYTLKGNVIRISTFEQLNNYAFSRVYDIRDLIRSATTFNPRESTRNVADCLIQLIEKESMPSSESIREGFNAYIEEVGGRLIISTDANGHQAVERLLQLLREKQQP